MYLLGVALGGAALERPFGAEELVLEVVVHKLLDLGDLLQSLVLGIFGR